MPSNTTDSAGAPTSLPAVGSVCEVEMRGRHLCARPVHVTQDGVDVIPSCLMHSSDPEKGNASLRTLFNEEIDAVLVAAMGRSADFSHFVFPADYIAPAVLKPACNFFNAKFLGKASFEATKFMQDTTFELATFFGACTFQNAEFMHEADFFETRFESKACFAGANFDRRAVFSKANFRGLADFHSSRFSRTTRFRLTSFRPADSLLGKLEPSPIFSLASFVQPDVLFYKTHLEQAIFVNCDVSNVLFSAVSWRERKGSGKAMLFEEVLPLENKYALPLLTEDGFRNFELIAQTYQQLQNNYDRRVDYWTAGGFHYGAMEMQRLSIRRGTKWTGLRSWWHPNMSLIAWYRNASLYGESFVRPGALLGLTLLSFTLLYPLFGLRPSTPADASAQTYRSVWPEHGSLRDDFLSEAALVGRGAIAALDTATFQRTTEFTPLYPWGRLGAIVETLLTSSLFALFLLAVRRQFRR